jgi:hypothetical protein
VSTRPPLPDRPPPERSRGALQDDAQLRRRRALGVLALAGLAFVIGAIAGASHSPSYAHELAERFTAAWARSDYASMYADIDAEARREVTPSEFASSYSSALTTATATVTGLRVTDKPRDARGGGVAV